MRSRKLVDSSFSKSHSFKVAVSLDTYLFDNDILQPSVRLASTEFTIGLFCCSTQGRALPAGEGAPDCRAGLRRGLLKKYCISSGRPRGIVWVWWADSTRRMAPRGHWDPRSRRDSRCGLLAEARCLAMTCDSFACEAIFNALCFWSFFPQQECVNFIQSREPSELNEWWIRRDCKYCLLADSAFLTPLVMTWAAAGH